MRLAWSGTAATILALALPSTVGRGRCFEYSNADLRLAARGYGEFDALCLRPVIACDALSIQPTNLRGYCAEPRIMSCSLISWPAIEAQTTRIASFASRSCSRISIW